MHAMSTNMTWQTFSFDSKDTEKLGELLGKHLKGGDVIELIADLGGGKTTLICGLAKGLGSKDIVSSPTFTLSNIYKCKDGLEIHHLDFYRLSEPGVVADQLSESLENPKVVTVIEWSQIVKDVLPLDRITIELSPTPDNADERQIDFSYPESKLMTIKKLETDWLSLKP